MAGEGKGDLFDIGLTLLRSLLCLRQCWGRYFIRNCSGTSESLPRSPSEVTAHVSQSQVLLILLLRFICHKYYLKQESKVHSIIAYSVYSTQYMIKKSKYSHLNYTLNLKQHSLKNRRLGSMPVINNKVIAMKNIRINSSILESLHIFEAKPIRTKCRVNLI